MTSCLNSFEEEFKVKLHLQQLNIHINDIEVIQPIDEQIVQFSIQVQQSTLFKLKLGMVQFQRNHHWHAKFRNSARHNLLELLDETDDHVVDALTAGNIFGTSSGNQPHQHGYDYHKLLHCYRGLSINNPN
uniref:(northern house mosquito) hypothetical protein n=1 Tax=Culex pipiens TaxID=7175 RepID=A0A8D8GL00_CULPI